MGQIVLVAVLLALVSVPVLVSSLLYHPRYHYLQVQGLLIEILGVLFVANTLKLYHWPSQRTIRSAAFPMIGDRYPGAIASAKPRARLECPR